MATTGSVRGYILFQVIVTVVQIPVVVAARLLLMLLYEINVHIFHSCCISTTSNVVPELLEEPKFVEI